MQYCEMSKEELLKLKEELDETYKEAQSKGLSLNMSRGQQHSLILLWICLILLTVLQI